MSQAKSALETLSKVAAAEAAIKRFLATARRPALFEPGEAPLELRPESYLLEYRTGRLVIQVWDRDRYLSRRVTALQAERPGRLELVVERFGKREGRLMLVDMERTESVQWGRQAMRLVVRERLRHALARQWPDWRLVELSAEPNLEESLSPVCPRAMVKKGSRAWAALMAPEEPDASSTALSFGLIWLDYLRRREKHVAVEGLLLFLPDGYEHTTCLRVPWLDSTRARILVYVYTPEGGEEPVDPAEYTNLDTVLEDQRRARPACPPLWEALLARVKDLPGVEEITRSDGGRSLRVRGLEFAELAGSTVRFGVEQRRRASERHLDEIARLAAQLGRLRRAEATDRANPLYRLLPERWLESQVRAHLERIDASLRPQPVYGQVPAFAGGERGVIDLLAVDCTGRLAVLELKASQDIHLPMQALDYWMRVRWHLEQGDFPRCGYFPGISLRPDPPRLLLIAPALEFHPTSETILSFFHPQVEVERIGLGVEWRKEIQVLFRARGAERPEL